jgi:hypothetical protein
MTSSITTITAATDGKTADGQRPDEREHSLAALRRMEARGLIGLACDVLDETFSLGHQMCRAIYDKEQIVADGRLQQLLDETLTCLQTAEHYLLMLGSVFEECPRTTGPGNPGP